MVRQHTQIEALNVLGHDIRLHAGTCSKTVKHHKSVTSSPFRRRAAVDKAWTSANCEVFWKSRTSKSLMRKPEAPSQQYGMCFQVLQCDQDRRSFVQAES